MRAPLYDFRDRFVICSVYLSDPGNGVVNIVAAREIGRLPSNATRVHWRLMTYRPVDTNDEVSAVSKMR